ncbi:MAG: DUF4159 domain-containing protein [Pseudomonadota bacterium]
MLGIGALGFLSPWVLAGLVAIPVLWWLLRAIPPAPKRLTFPGVRLLLGLQDPDRQAAVTPWWLLLLRALAVLAVIVGFSQPVLYPSARLSDDGTGPVLLMLDQGWGSAPDWSDARAAGLAAVDEASRTGRSVILWRAASETGLPEPVPPAEARSLLEASQPAPWWPDYEAVLETLQSGEVELPSETVWIHAGLDDTAGSAAPLADWLLAQGPLRLIGPAEAAKAVTPPRLDEGRMQAEVLRTGGAPDEAAVFAIAEAEGGGERRIGVAGVSFAEGETAATAIFDLPPELMGEVTRIQLASRATAGGSALADAALRRIRAVIVDPAAGDTTATLTSASHYLRQALAPEADVSEAPLGTAMDREPAAIVLADQGDFTAGERLRLTRWVEEGGLLLRFAGPRLAATVGQSLGGDAAGVAGEDPLLPVRLRRGGRMLGGSLAWGQPQSLGPFDSRGPFRALTVPEDVAVRTQVLAQPAPTLADRTWARLEDGTPLVTANGLGDGLVVLFHVSADAEWSTLPLSGLFVEMLGRILALAPGQVPEPPAEAELAGTLWRAELQMGADGTPRPASGPVDPVPGERMVAREIGPDLVPGLYLRVDGQGTTPRAETLVLNLTKEGDTLSPFPPAPFGAISETFGGNEPVRIWPWLIVLAIGLAVIDAVATLWISGRLAGSWARPLAGSVVAGGLALAALGGGEAVAQDRGEGDPALIAAAAETTLGYIVTGDQRIDRVSKQAMAGLGFQLSRRTAVEPGPPMGVEPEEDELNLYPVLYWPLTGGTEPTDVMLERLATYLQGGGLLLIDTQNGRAGFDGASAAVMRQIARALSLPPLEPIDGDHVLSRAFYLLNAYPGRWRGGRVWAEAPPEGRTADPDSLDLPQFDRVDDNVSPVIVGSADWAAAWAIDDRGEPIYPVGRPGDRQREMAIRFGINVVMYALTGNYKSDQVHAPAVLQRLGQ